MIKHLIPVIIIAICLFLPATTYAQEDITLIENTTESVLWYSK
jgi:hypothetical protein